MARKCGKTVKKVDKLKLIKTVKKVDGKDLWSCLKSAKKSQKNPGSQTCSTISRNDQQFSSNDSDNPQMNDTLPCSTVSRNDQQFSLSDSDNPQMNDTIPCSTVSSNDQQSNLIVVPNIIFSMNSKSSIINCISIRNKNELIFLQEYFDFKIENWKKLSPFNLLENVRSYEVGSPEYLKIICSINKVLNGFAFEIFQELGFLFPYQCPSSIVMSITTIFQERFKQINDLVINYQKKYPNRRFNKFREGNLAIVSHKRIPVLEKMENKLLSWITKQVSMGFDCTKREVCLMNRLCEQLGIVTKLYCSRGWFERFKKKE
ncbi:hypothetical protein BLOT_016834 [Blomia tropicalis]|nr:hypothetical protein BLOT_016834 [Blomia tropicalis]